MVSRIDRPERSAVPSTAHDDVLHPVEFGHQLTDLVRRLDATLQHLPKTSEPLYHDFILDLLPNAWVTMHTESRPDKWFCYCPNVANASLLVFPSVGYPSAPKAFVVGPGESVKLPGLSQHFAVLNTGTVEVRDIIVIALTGYDIEYSPKQ